MTLLALLFCDDPELLRLRQNWLEQKLNRQTGQQIVARPFANGLALSAFRKASTVVDMLDLAGDIVGRFGWSRQALDADGRPAAHYFETLLQHMEAMSSIWWWNHKAGQLSLATDPVGARPFYYVQDKNSIVLSSALWLLEACPWIDHVLDDSALLQRLTLGYCLNGATPYRAIHRVQGGTKVDFFQGAPERIQRQHWHRWDSVATDRRPLDLQLDEIQECFLRAIAQQDDGAEVPVAALSGGLDTRTVIAGLMAVKRAPTCLTFTWRNSLDGTIAGDFAGAAHLAQQVISVPRPLDEPFLVKSGKALISPVFQAPADGALRLWTGYGGSVGAGYVHSSPQAVMQARAGDTPGVVRALLRAKRAGVSPFLFGGSKARSLTMQLEDQLVAALEAHKPDDLGRRIQIYLLENQEAEQLRALSENADLLGFDVAAPFYDPQLLAKWLAVPLDAAMNHQAYVQWKQRLPNVVQSVPWQAYPGHVQSPLPLPKQADQWTDKDALYQRQLANNDLVFIQKCQEAGVGASSRIAYWRLALARQVVTLGLYRHSYLLRTEAAYAAFEQGKGALLLDGIAPIF
jgi:asparagine synthase (glutamine-hydrolysing)